MYKRNQQLITNRGINGNVACNAPAILNDVNGAIAAINAAGGLLPVNPPFEKHPYLNLVDYQMQDFEKYIIGTMPPISYILDLLANPAILNLIKPGGRNIPKSKTPFFHGNQDDLWNLLLTNAEFVVFNAIINRNQRRTFLINKLIELHINYSDIIKKVQRESYDADDKGLNNICPNLCLIKHILNNKNSKYLMFDTSTAHYSTGIKVNQKFCQDGNPGEVNVNNVQSFDLFLRTLQGLGFSLEIDFLNRLNWQNTQVWNQINSVNANFLNANFKTKVLTRLKIKNSKSFKICDNNFDALEQVFTIITGPSPIIKDRAKGKNIVFKNWLIANPAQEYNDFRQRIYQLFRAENWSALQAMNI